jgi:hypothetical protein
MVIFIRINTFQTLIWPRETRFWRHQRAMFSSMIYTRRRSRPRKNAHVEKTANVRWNCLDCHFISIWTCLSILKCNRTFFLPSSHARPFPPQQYSPAGPRKGCRGGLPSVRSQLRFVSPACGVRSRPAQPRFTPGLTPVRVDSPSSFPILAPSKFRPWQSFKPRAPMPLFNPRGALPEESHSGQKSTPQTRQIHGR